MCSLKDDFLEHVHVCVHIILTRTFSEKLKNLLDKYIKQEYYFPAVVLSLRESTEN